MPSARRPATGPFPPPPPPSRARGGAAPGDAGSAALAALAALAAATVAAGVVVSGPARAQGRTLTVGAGGRFATLAEALREVADGDTLLLAEGEYRGDVGVLAAQDVTLRGAGRGAVLHADGRHAEGKAILVVRGTARLENLEFRGCRVPSGNGAGIRFERGALRLERCRFLDNENGLLSAHGGEMALDIVECVFGDAPRHAGLLHHLLYVGGIGRLHVERSRFHNGFRGHLLKSRAAVNRVVGNRFDDGDTGEASYEMEFPNGGVAVVAGNLVVQSPGSHNPALLSMGAEAGPGSRGVLRLTRNTFVDGGLPQARFVRVWEERLTGGVDVQASGNLFVGEATADRVAADDATLGNHRVPRGELDAQGRLPRRHRLHRLSGAVA